MAVVATRVINLTIPTRDLSLLPTARSIRSVLSSRNLTGMAGVRVFGGDDKLGWKLWGQDDIHPFDYPSGVDSTKTMENLP